MEKIVKIVVELVYDDQYHDDVDFRDKESVARLINEQMLEDEYLLFELDGDNIVSVVNREDTVRNF